MRSTVDLAHIPEIASWRDFPTEPTYLWPMRVALYLRRSTNDQLQAESLITQEELLRSFAAAEGHEVVSVFVDSASGRSIRKRDGFKELLAAVDRGGQFEAIIVRDVSRWGRFENVDESAYHEFYCLSRGVRVLYVEESFRDDDSPYAVLMKTLKRVLASEFSRDKSRMVRYTQARVVSRGFRHGGPPPYGMERVMVTLDGAPIQPMAEGEWKRLSTNRTKLQPGLPREVEIVRRIFSLYVDDRLCRFQIARRLNAESIPSPAGVRWAIPTLTAILSNPAYAGVASYKQRKRGEERGCVPDLFKNPEEIVTCEGAWKPIIAPKVWADANARLKSDAWERNNRDLPGQIRKAVETWGYVSPDAVRSIDSRVAWDAYRRSFKDGYIGALEIAYREEIGAALVVLRGAALTGHEVREEPHQWLIDGRLKVGFRFSFPRAWLGGLHWEFRFSGAETDDVTIGLGFSPPPKVRHVETFFFTNKRIRKRLRIFPNIAGGKAYRGSVRGVTSEQLQRLIARALIWRCEKTRNEFLEAAQSCMVIDPTAMARQLDWPAHRVRWMYEKLKKEGVALPPQRVKLGRRIGVVCPLCRSVRKMTPAWALRLKTHLCGQCSLSLRRKEKSRVQCPTCGKVRMVWPSALQKMSNGADTICRSCVARVARQRHFGSLPGQT